MDRHRSDGADGEPGSPQLGGQKFFSYADLEERYGKTRVTIWRWVCKKLLPAPYDIGPGSVGFAVQEIEERDAKLPRKTYGQEASA